ncbi:hypothetical protein [Pseudoduganella namucuonensis]|uniref:Uncharacterized protein n=1 Tax=Pseudoduganella namucuonensis TaxID=1035707 RepID=A0A1I7M4E9_9BURK|nr:hypothetical protein [Pseudoduganella namucuonensis]SFV16805.1 hypothetical protein SAMN05216552_105533 [Pseudoduganella namucuonensis]
MDGMNSRSESSLRQECGDALEDESVPGLMEWMEMERWRADWQPVPDPYVGTEQLEAIFQRVVRHGYAAYVRGARVMPDLFASDSSLASMWQAGYANARMDAELISPPVDPRVQTSSIKSYAGGRGCVTEVGRKVLHGRFAKDIIEEDTMTTFVLHFSAYGNFGRNRHYVFDVRARNLEAAIRSVEKVYPSYFYRGCSDSYLAWE